MGTRISGREAEHVLDIALALVDGSRIVRASRSPTAEHLVSTSSAVKDFTRSARSQSDSVVKLLHALGSAHIKRLAHESGLTYGFVCCGNGHIADIAVEGSRKGFATAVENLVAEGEGSTLGVAGRHVNLRKRPGKGSGIQGGVIKLVVNHRAIVATEDGQHTIGEDGGVVIQGLGHFGAGGPLAQSATSAD